MIMKWQYVYHFIKIGDNKMKCDNCLCSSTYTKDYEHNYNIKGKEIKFISTRRFCQECDSLVYDAELDNEASRKAIEIYNRNYGICKDDIVNLRNKYNLSQELFSKIIGCAKKTLVSYEKGTAIPNDNYIIIINALISKPDTIINLIESNKKQFTDREYCRIQEKISKFSNNEKQLFYNNDFEPSEYNGYTRINKSKIVNLILIFAKKGILKTKLLKEMFYADFLNYKNTGASITGLEYAKLPYGPVPDDFEKIITECKNKKLISYSIEYINEYELHNIKCLTEIDETVFTKEELNIIDKVIKFFKDYKSKEIADFSHEEKAYIETNFSDKISYDYAFDIERVI